MSTIPKEEHAKELLTMDLDYDPLPVTRALGVQWCVETDQFSFSIIVKNKPMTRRGILSVVSALYDPLGFVAPVILHAKQLLQDLCKEKRLGWDDEVPGEYHTRWHQWLSTLPKLQQLFIDRSFKPSGFSHVTSTQLHVFADSSSVAYGCVVYLRLTDDCDRCHVSFVSGKARLAPIQTTG
jgi:hypothetical protein